MKHQFFHAVVFWILVAAVAGAPGCKKNEPTPFDVQLVTSPPAQGNTCPSEGLGGLDKTVIHSVRLTFFDESLGDPSLSSFVCDTLINADDSGAVFYLEADKTTHLTVWAEAFGVPEGEDATPLVASGQITHLPFSGEVDTPRIFMALTGRMGCSLGSLSKARAFHSVTALPGGYALVAGGLVATNGSVTAVAEGSGLLLTDELEIYSSQTGRFVQPDLAGEEGIPRAFHQAFLVAAEEGENPRVLLLGGVGQGDVPPGNGVVKIRTGPQHPLRLTPDPSALPAAPMLLEIDMSVDPPLVTRSSDTLGDWPSAYFQAGAYHSGDGACVLGGLTTVSSTGAIEPLTAIDLGYHDSEEHYPLTGSMSIPRLGHTVSIFSDGVSGLIWGGNLGQAAPATSVAERLAVQPPPPLTNIMTMDASSSTAATPIPTAFHTATVLSDDDVLVTGGFVVEGGLALNPDGAASIVRIRRNGNQFEYYPQEAAEFTPVGYHAAVGLPDGTVLITGGSPYFVPAGTSCPDGENAWTCSMAQAWIYTPGVFPSDGGTLSSLAHAELQVPRFGHTMTLLANGTVVIVGGLRRDGSTLYTEPSAEIYNSSTGTTGEDTLLQRLPGGLYSEEKVCKTF